MDTLKQHSKIKRPTFIHIQPADIGAGAIELAGVRDPKFLTAGAQGHNTIYRGTLKSFQFPALSACWSTIVAIIFLD